MRIKVRVLLVLVLLGSMYVSVSAQTVLNGKWMGEAKITNPASGEPILMKYTLDLKTNASALTGSMNSSGPTQEVKADLAEGKVSGTKVSFKTVAFNTVVTWTGEVQKDELILTRQPQGTASGTRVTFRRAK